MKVVHSLQALPRLRLQDLAHFKVREERLCRKPMRFDRAHVTQASAAQSKQDY